MHANINHCNDIYILNGIINRPTITERMIAGIPKARENKLRIAQILVATKASARKSCGASKFGGGVATTVGN